MIEINLLPGSTKRPARRGLPRLGGGGGAKRAIKLPEFDRALAIIAVLAVLVVAAVAYLHLTNTARLGELRAEEEAAERDSARYAVLRAQGDSLRDQLSLIGQKLEVIQTIDAARFVWPHILDEVSRAVPPYVWLINMTQAASDAGLPRVRIEGRAGNLFALSRYVQQLEASPFLGGARLMSSTQAQTDQRVVYNFVLEVGYRQPPPDAIQTVPVFAAAQPEE